MATITARPKRDGSVSYTAQIKIWRAGVVVHSEARTFSRKALAEAWAKRRELELEHPGAMEKAKAGDTSLGALIAWYVADFAAIGKWGRTKHADLKRLQAHDVAKVAVVGLSAQTLIDHVRKRRTEGAGPATALNDLVWIGVVLRAAKSVRGLPVRPEVVTEARSACRELRLVAKAKERDRLPTYGELQRLDEYFEYQDSHSDIPMRQVMWFAIYSARRQDEITRLLRSDDEAGRRMGIVRDAKHPTAKDGNHRRFRYVRAAWEIAALQPPGPQAFPYSARSISARFTRACHVLGIVGLHFHDLRHEATTRLFEARLSIPEVATYTLHESWAVLKRYEHGAAGRQLFNAPFLPPEALETPTGF